MKKFLISFIIPILAFAVGVFIYRNSTPKVSLENISEHIWFYDGMNVEIEDYAQLEFFDENAWYIGEPFEKREIFTYLDLSENSTNLENLQSELKKNLSKYHNRRAKVLIKGKIENNCGNLFAGITRCCFGDSITIHTTQIIQLSPVEDHTRPE